MKAGGCYIVQVTSSAMHWNALAAAIAIANRHRRQHRLHSNVLHQPISAPPCGYMALDAAANCLILFFEMPSMSTIPS